MGHRIAIHRLFFWGALFFGSSFLALAQTNGLPLGAHEIRYGVIGDSYSNGEGATVRDAWPAVLTRHLVASGAPVVLVANPSKTGWTTQQAIDGESAVWKAARPDFATLQIGVNDWVQGVAADTFRRNLVRLIDEMLKVLPDKSRLLVVTIPDFSVTPSGAMFGGGRDISRGLAEFNQIIRQEAVKRQLKVVDVYPLSQKVRGQPALVARDGLHPSAKEYALWEEIIFPVAKEILSVSATKSTH